LPRRRRRRRLFCPSSCHNFLVKIYLVGLCNHIPKLGKSFLNEGKVYLSLSVNNQFSSINQASSNFFILSAFGVKLSQSSKKSFGLNHNSSTVLSNFQPFVLSLCCSSNSLSVQYAELFSFPLSHSVSNFLAKFSTSTSDINLFLTHSLSTISSRSSHICSLIEGQYLSA